MLLGRHAELPLGASTSLSGILHLSIQGDLSNSVTLTVFSQPLTFFSPQVGLWGTCSLT